MPNDNNHMENIRSNPNILIPHCFSFGMVPWGVIFKRSRPRSKKKRYERNFETFDNVVLYVSSCVNKNHTNLTCDIMPLINFIIITQNDHAQGRGGTRAGMKNEKRLSPRHLEQFVLRSFMFLILCCRNC